MSPELIQSTLEKCLGIPEVMADANYCEFHCILEVAADNGIVRKFDVLPSHAHSPAIHLRASEATWKKVWSLNPPVGYQSIGALRRQVPDFTLAGEDIHIAQSLPFLERLLEAFRNIIHPRDPIQINWDGLENISGSYLKVGAQKDYWVYQEQSGPPHQPAILMLHTAGADSRQWHGLMSSKLLQSEWSMHAFDLPGHGRSPLPPGSPNWNWHLTEADYISWIIDYMDAANIKQAILMGCSMGSAVGLALLSKHPNRFIGGILLEMPYCSPGRRSPYLNHPKVHGARLAGAWVGSLLSPSSPKSRKDYATWIYSQGAPSVYDGDLAFYSDVFDAHHHTGSVNTQKTPLWLLTGNYDYSATPQDTLKVANEIPGSIFIELKGFGHFPMVENPEGLIPHLLTPLSELKKRINN